jgi:hypothetical protein
MPLNATVGTAVTLNLSVDRATRADPCDANKLKLPAMMAGYFRLLYCRNTGVTTIVSVFLTDFDHSTHFLLGCNIYLRNDVNGTYFASFITSIYLWTNGFYLGGTRYRGFYIHFVTRSLTYTYST